MSAEASQEKVRVGLLGVGLMGFAMADRLLDRGIAVIAWDRDAEHLRALEGRGGQSAVRPSDVVSGAGVVITMLPTAAVILDVVAPLLETWPQDTIWLQMSSVGAAEADQLTRVAEKHAVRLVDAPVSGSTHPAEEGQLTILASGPDSARTRARAGLRRAGVAGAVGGGGRDGLAPETCGQPLDDRMVAALAESMQLCEAMGLDQQQFIALLDGGPLGSSTRCRSWTRCGATSTRPAFPSGLP